MKFKVLLFSLVLSNQAFAVGNVKNLGNIFANFNDVWINILNFVVFIVPILGMVAIISILTRAVDGLKKGREGIKPTTFFFGLIGAFGLMGLVKVLDGVGKDLLDEGTGGPLEELSSQLYQSSDMLVYVNEYLNSDVSVMAFTSVVNLIKLVGIIVVIKALYSLKDFGNRGGGGEVTFFKFALQFIPGVFMWYIIPVSEMFLSTMQGK